MTAHSGFPTARQADQYKHSAVSLKGGEGAVKTAPRNLILEYLHVTQALKKLS
jgi:hypothetical protein